MEIEINCSVGDSKEDIFLVEEEHSAKHIGSGASRVMATPWMIAFMERVSHRLLAGNLPLGYSSVGVMINVRHVAPTPVGKNIRVRTEIIGIEGLRVVFQVDAWDDYELVGSGTHERFIIDTERFLRRLDKKNL